MLDESVEEESLLVNKTTYSFDDSTCGSGTIEKIELINFMCHSHLEIELSPHINFISGQNGSGKSAILVAVVTCLGAPARFSNRGSKIGDLVKTGKNNATIRITLRNEGIESFKSSLYGSSIVVERRISRKGTSKYRIFNEKNEECSSDRNELVAMMEQFNIQVENPCNILMQEAAKTFLNSNKSEKKYELFLKATQLEKINYDIKRAIEFNRDLEETLNAKKKVLPELVNEISKLEKEIKVIQQLNQQRGNLKTLRNNYAWAYIQQQESELFSLNNDLSRIKLDQEYIKKEMETPEARLDECKTARVEKQQEIERIKEEVMNFMETKNQLENKSKALKAKINVYEEDIKHSENEIMRYKNREERILRELQGLKREIFVDHETKKNSIAAQIEEKNDQLQILNTEKINNSHLVNVIDTKLATFNDEILNNSRNLNEMKKEFSSIQQKLTNLRERSNNSLAAFGKHAVILVELIEKNKLLFTVKPIGPIGFYLKLNNSVWTKAVDTACGNMLDAFVLNQKADAAALRNLCAANNLKTPHMVLASINVNRHNIPSKYLPDSHFQTVMNVLNIKSDIVFNVLVDRCSIESIILLKDDKEAEEVVFNSKFSENPPNVKLAITLDGSKYTWHAGSQLLTPAQDKTPRLTEDLAESTKNLENQYDKLRFNIQSLSSKIEEIKKDSYDAVHEREKLYSSQKKQDLQILKLDDEIRELSQPMASSTKNYSIKELEENLENLKIQREEMERRKSNLLEEFNEHVNELEKIKDQTKSNYLSIEQVSENVNKEAQELDEINTVITRQAQRVAKYQTAIEKLSLVIIERQKIVDEKNEQISSDIEKALQLCPRPSEPIKDTPDELMRQIDVTERMINEHQESQNLSDKIINKYKKTKADYKHLKTLVEKMQLINMKMQKMIAIRFRTWKLFRKFIGQRVRALFIGYLSQRGFNGSLNFDHEEAALDIYVNTELKDGLRNELRSTKTLSGGEKSYSTVSFLLALWDCIESPFLAMDEFDVFMDSINRQISIELLIKATKNKLHRQHIFLTPQELSTVTSDEKFVKILKMKPPERDQ